MSLVTMRKQLNAHHHTGAGEELQEPAIIKHRTSECNDRDDRRVINIT